MNATASAPVNKKAADILLSAGLVNKDDYGKILTFLQRNRAQRSEEALIEMSVVTEAALLQALSAYYKTKFITTEKLEKAQLSPELSGLIPKKVAETLAVYPVMHDSRANVLLVATADPDNLEVLNELLLVSGVSKITPVVARPAAVTAAIAAGYSNDRRLFFGLRPVDPEAERKREMDAMRIQFDSDFSNRHERVLSENDIGTGGGGGRPQAPPPPPHGHHASAQTDPRRAPPPGRPPPPPLPPGARGGSVVAPLPTVPTGARPAELPGPMMAPAPMPQAAPLAPAPPPVAQPSYETTIELLNVLISLLENSRVDLRGHSAQTARLVRRLAERINLARESIAACVMAAFIHDLGKMGQYHLTLLNAGEYEGHRTAAQKAYDTPLRLLEAVHLPPETLHGVEHMYERYDGKGFPDGLASKEIPLVSRVLAIVDTYVDLTQNPRNPFRKALNVGEALSVLEKYRESLFDPSLVDLFKTIVAGEGVRARLLANRYVALLVDADPEETTVLELRMIEQGFEVKIARSVPDALRILGQGEIGIVVSEVDISGGDGLALLAEARRHPWGKDLPWVIHTRRQGRTEAQRAFDLGVLDYASKLAPTDVLVAKIKTMLDQRAVGSHSGRGVSGSLSEMGIADLVQVLWHARKTGKLRLQAGSETGEIHLVDGQVVQAIWGRFRGEAAFYSIVRLREGDFVLDPAFRPQERGITLSTESLLLESMRRMDEGIAP